LGWENKTPQLPPNQSWKLILPSVESAVKSGASAFKLIAIVPPPELAAVLSRGA
jgi:hypothetical protein